MEVKDFTTGLWTDAINVRSFVFNNISPYHGTSDFLVGPTPRTEKLWAICKDAMAEERAKNGVRCLDTDTISTVDAFDPGYRAGVFLAHSDGPHASGHGHSDQRCGVCFRLGDAGGGLGRDHFARKIKNAAAVFGL